MKAIHLKDNEIAPKMDSPNFERLHKVRFFNRYSKQ